MVVGSNPTGSTKSIRIRQPVCSFVWISGVVAERSNATVPKAAGVQAPGGSILPTPRTPHENRSHEGFIEVWPVCPVLKTLAWMVGRAVKAQSC